MATSAQLKSSIKQIETAMKNKALKATSLAKFQTQLDRLKGELASLNSPKPKKGVTKAKVLTKLQKLKLIIKADKELKGYKNSGIDIEKDADEPAMKRGVRFSKGLRANKFGTAAENKGRRYYEYRLNRADVKQPPKKYPKLEDGGYMAEGGIINVNGEQLSVREFVKRNKTKSEEQKLSEYDIEQIKQLKEGNSLNFFVGQKMMQVYKVGSNLKMAKGGKTKIELKDASNLSNQERFELKFLKALSGFNKGLNINSLYEVLGFSNYRFNKYASDEEVQQVKNTLSSLMNKGYVENSDFGYSQTVEGRKYIDSFEYGSYEQGGMMAKGGIVEHGLRLNDKIISGGGIGKTTVRVRNENYNEDARVDLNTGKRTLLEYNRKSKKWEEKMSDGHMMAKGGEVEAKYKVGDMVYSYQNKNEAAQISYVKFVPYDSQSGKSDKDKYIYKLKLADGYSNWINEESLSKSKMSEGGYMEHGGSLGSVKSSMHRYDK